MDSQIPVRVGTAVWCLAVILSSHPARGTSPSGTSAQPKEKADWVISAKKSAPATKVEKSWTKEELAERPGPEVEGIVSIVRRKVADFIDAIAAKDKGVSAKSGLLKLQKDNQEISEKEYNMMIATMRPVAKRTEGNSDGLRTYLSSQSNNVAADRVSGEIPFLSQFKQGLAFDLGFSKKEKPKARTPRAQRYGLVLREIKSDREFVLREQQALDENGEVQFASQSELMWTIGPVTEENRKLFNDAPENFDSIAGDSTWDKVSLPSPDLKFKVAPASTNVKDYLGATDPAYVVTLTQVENLYQLSYISRDKDGKPKTSHTFEVPLVGTLSIVRVYDQKGTPVRAEMRRVLISDRAPTVNFKYLDQEKFYGSESICTFGDHTIKFATERRLGPTDAKRPPIRYNTSYSYDF